MQHALRGLPASSTTSYSKTIIAEYYYDNRLLFWEVYI